MKKPGFPIQLGTYKEIIFLSEDCVPDTHSFCKVRSE